MKDEFDIEISRHQAGYYDPTRRTGGEPAKKWTKLFHEAREAYINGRDNVAIAHERWRLDQLEAGYRRLRQHDPEAAAALLEQAAKETGGKYTNEHQIDHGGEVGVTGGVVFTPPGQQQTTEDSSEASEEE